MSGLRAHPGGRPPPPLDMRPQMVSGAPSWPGRPTLARRTFAAWVRRLGAALAPWPAQCGSRRQQHAVTWCCTASSAGTPCRLLHGVSFSTHCRVSSRSILVVSDLSQQLQTRHHTTRSPMTTGHGTNHSQNGGSTGCGSPCQYRFANNDFTAGDLLGSSKRMSARKACSETTL